MSTYNDLLSRIKTGYKDYKHIPAHKLMTIDDDIENAITKAYVNGEITEDQYERLLINEGRYRHEI